MSRQTGKNGEGTPAVRPWRSPCRWNRLWTGVPLLLLFLALPEFAHPADKASDATVPASRASSPAIVVGFVGGFVHHDDPRHAEVQLAQKLQATYADHLHSEVFDNHHRKDAHRAIVKWLDTDSDGKLSEAEKRASRIILYGHSWGAAAAISLASELQRENIPVLLTVQVDSITKIGQNDRVVPANVAKAVNFYQTRGLLHGQSRIVAADPERTEILGEFHLEYKRLPQECREYPWFDRLLFKGHTAIECDPHVWSQIGDLIDSSLSPGNTQLVGDAAVR